MTDDAPIVRYPFRLRDPLTGKWYRARWKASLDDIESRGGVVDGPPETYTNLGPTSNFQVERRPAPFDDPPLMHPERESPPAIDQLESVLACVFLRRYATYCVRRKRYAQAQGAVALCRHPDQPTNDRDFFLLLRVWGIASPPVQKRRIWRVPSAIIVADWRLASATVRLRAEPIMAFAPLNHILMYGFFLSQGFFISDFA